MTHHSSIRDVMTENPRSITVDQPVVEAARIMRDEDVGLVPIVEGDRLVGTVTDRDITVRVVAENRDPSSTTVHEVASTDLVTVDPQQDLDEALRLMAEHQVRRLPVVEEDGRLVGIVAQADVARHGDDRQTGQVVEQISQYVDAPGQAVEPTSTTSNAKTKNPPIARGVLQCIQSAVRRTLRPDRADLRCKRSQERQYRNQCSTCVHRDLPSAVRRYRDVPGPGGAYYTR